MGTAMQRVIYTARSAQVEKVLAVLLSRGLHPSTEVDTVMAMPWVSTGLGQVSVSVPESEASEAQAILEAVEAPHLAKASQVARHVGSRLLVASSFVVAGMSAGMFSNNGARWLKVVALGCCVVGLAMFVRLVGEGRKDAR